MESGSWTLLRLSIVGLILFQIAESAVLMVTAEIGLGGVVGVKSLSGAIAMRCPAADRSPVPRQADQLGAAVAATAGRCRDDE